MNLESTALALPSAATSLAASFLRHCLREAVAGLPYDADRVGELLRDDDVYFVAADQLVGDAHRRGWRAVRVDLEGLAGFRAGVLEHGCSGFFRNGFEVIFFGEFALGPEDA